MDLLLCMFFPLALAVSYTPAQTCSLAIQFRRVTKGADALEHRKRPLPWHTYLPKVMSWLLMYDSATKVP